MTRRERARQARQDRLTLHAREALQDVAEAREGVSCKDDRTMRHKARLTAHAQALAAEQGPAYVVALFGSLAGHFGGDLSPRSIARRDAEKVFGGGA